VFSGLKHPNAKLTFQKDEVLVAQNVERLPVDKLREAVSEIKKKPSLLKFSTRAGPLKIPLYYKFD